MIYPSAVVNGDPISVYFGLSIILLINVVSQVMHIIEQPTKSNLLLDLNNFSNSVEGRYTKPRKLSDYCKAHTLMSGLTLKHFMK